MDKIADAFFAHLDPDLFQRRKPFIMAKEEQKGLRLTQLEPKDSGGLPKKLARSGRDALSRRRRRRNFLPA